MPDTTWATSRSPPGSSRDRWSSPGFDAIYTLSTRHQRFASARLLSSYLTHSRRAFSATLTTPALDRRSLRWFETSPCRAIPEGLPPSLAQHRISASTFYIDASSAFVAHITRITGDSGRGSPALSRVDIGYTAHARSVRVRSDTAPSTRSADPA